MAAEESGRVEQQSSDQATGDERTTRIFVLVMFAVNLALVYAAFLPNMNEINPWDEAAYVHGGRSLWSGGWPSLAGNPLVSLLYAITYLPFAGSPFWLIHSTSLGRVLLYTLLWLAAYKVAKQLKPSPLIMLGVVFVTPLTIKMLRFPSDPLFAGLAGLAFASILHYQKSEDWRSLRTASVFMGLASLARSDGLVLAPILVLLAALIAHSGGRRRALIASALPWAVIVLGYVGLRGIFTGDFTTGVPERTYHNFESGQQIILGDEFEAVNAVGEARSQAREIFGTAADNDGSVFTAILRNPQAYLDRLGPTLTALPRGLLQAYGIRFAVPLFALAGLGAFELFRAGGWRAVIPFFLWPMHLLTGLVITIFRDGHLKFPFYIVFGLASLGLATAVSRVSVRTRRTVWIAILAALTLYGVVDNKLAIAYGTGVLLVSLLAVWMIQRETRREMAALGLMILFAGGVILRDGFPSPKLRSLGERADERAVVYMVDELPPGSIVAAGSPGPVWMANMTFFNLAGSDVPRGRTSEQFLDWMLVQDVEAVYVDQTLSSTNSYYWGLISEQIGAGLERGFVGDEGDIQVLLVVEGE